MTLPVTEYQKVWRYIYSFRHNTGQTDRRTDGQNC